MASAQDLRKRIKSVTNTQQITKAMKMVASARLRRAQTKAEATRPYAEKIGQILRHMSNSDLEGFESPLLDVRPVERTCYIVVGADKGLAGAFSSNVLKFAMEELKGKDPSTYRVITAGRKPRDSMKSRGIHIDKSYAGFSDKPSYEHARAIMHEALSLYERHEVDEVIMIYTRFVNSMTQDLPYFFCVWPRCISFCLSPTKTSRSYHLHRFCYLLRISNTLYTLSQILCTSHTLRLLTGN